MKRRFDASFRLSPQQARVVWLLYAGSGRKQVAAALGRSIHLVDYHIQGI